MFNKLDCVSISSHMRHVTLGLLFVLLNAQRGDLTDVHQVSEVLIIVQSIAHHKLVWKHSESA